MEIGEIFGDALRYPLNHTKSLLIYIVVMIIIALIAAFTGVGVVAGQGTNNVLASGIIGIIGLLLIFVIGFFITGYGVDIIKLGIEKSDAAPEIDIGGQAIKGLKYIILVFVYFIIPLIIMTLLGYINNTLAVIVGLILLIIFGLALVMGEGRLADTGSLGHALNIPEAIKDLQNVGIVKTLLVIIIVGIVYFILNLIPGIFNSLGDIGVIIGAIISAIISAYLFFFSQRATGLLYSDA